MIEINHRITGEVLKTIDADTLQGANLTGAKLKGAYLYGKNLSKADLRCADIRNANLRSAYLEGAKGIMQWQAPQGEKRICYSVKHENCVMHKLGCFWGDTEDAIEAIRRKYGNDSMYEQLLMLNAKALENE